MLELDYWAQQNRWRDISIPEKGFLFLGALIFALFLKNPWMLFFLGLSIHGLLIFGARIPFSFFRRLWIGPLLFLMISLVTIAISVDSDSTKFIYSFSIGSWNIGVTLQGLQMSKTLFFRAFASISCLFGLASTTPASYGAAWLSRFSWLRPLAEIGLLTYRFIFITFGTSGQIYKAQQSRLGYQNMKGSIRSISLLAANLGLKSFLSVRSVYLALISRGYQEQLSYRYPDHSVSGTRLLFISIYLGFFCVGVWLQ